MAVRPLLVAGFWLLALAAEAQVQLGDCDKAGAPSAQILKAEGALAKGDRPMAQVYMSSIRRKEPESIHGWYLDAELALLVGEERAALALYEKVFAACPDYLSDLAFRIGALPCQENDAELGELERRFFGRQTKTVFAQSWI